MKQTISLIFRAIFALAAAAGLTAASPAFADGYFIVVGAKTIHSVADYPNAADAQAAAVALCVAGGESNIGCRNSPVNQGGIPDNNVFVFRPEAGNGFVGVGANLDAAIQNAADNCSAQNEGNPFCLTVITRETAMTCGDGTAAAAADSCSARYAPSAAGDCGMLERPDFYHEGACVDACPAGRPVNDGVGTACRARTMADCTDASMPILGSDGNCRARTMGDCTDAAMPILGSDGNCRARTADDCTDATPIFDDDGGECRALEASDCGMDERADFYDGGSCVASCPAVRPANDGPGTACEPLAAYLSDRHTRATCEDAGWDAEIMTEEDADSSDNIVAEVCEIPAVRDDSAVNAGGGGGESANAPRVAADGGELDFCVMARETGDDSFSGTNCNDGNLFGDAGFVRRPSAFDAAADQITVAVVDGAANRFFFGGAELAPAAAPVLRAAKRENKTVKAITYGTGGVIAALWAYWLAGGDWLLFDFAPHYGYAATESGYSYNFGGRVDFRKDAWSLYWTAGQRNADGDWGDFRIESGGEYDGGFWRASFSEVVSGGAADYDLSLSADIRGDIWRLSPTYRFHSRLTDGGLQSESANALNLEGALRYHRWTISSSAGVRWRRAGDFGDDAKFSISAARKF